MTDLTILTYPDPFLEQAAQAVENIDGNMQARIDCMADMMYEAQGVGLAANQVGWGRRLILYDVAPRDGEPQLIVLINPVITACEGQQVSSKEGCLSVPDFRADVKRAARVQVKALDRHGNPLSLEAEGLEAVVLQHEIDHLNGVLFITHLSALKRNMYKRAVKKRLRQKGSS